VTADLAWAIACVVFLLGMAGLIAVAVWDHRDCPACKARRQR
jgi:hypothetical protein